MGTLKFRGITWDHPRGYDPLVAASKLYAASNDIEVVWEKRTLKDFGDQSLKELAQDFDFLIVDHPHSGVAAAENFLIPLDEYLSKEAYESLKQEFVGPCFESYHYEGHQWALPIDAALQTAALRPDLLKGKIPTTWKEVLNVNKLGMALCPTDSLCTFLSLTAQFGIPINERYDVLVHEITGIKVLELMRELVKKANPNCLDWNPIQLFDHMCDTDDISYTPLAFCYTNYSRKGFRKNKLSFTNPPTGKNSVLGGAGIAVSSNCQNQMEAVNHASWIVGESIQKDCYVKTQGQPANRAAWEDDTANEMTANFFKNLTESMAYPYVRPRFQNWPKFQEHLGNVVHECLSKNLDCEKVIQYLNQEFKKIKPTCQIC